ncbi:putative expressed protein [Lyophyllum shimeji]|uniref:Expressed protein n=1 Tax=Lyophyllum shimeji TaxID=47721 RepID=A0A9P3UR65_LYOSH|nr:putative expressed protein [Lyophyllum shimeji]
MAFLQKLVFLLTLLSCLVGLGSAAPLRARPRDPPPPAITPVPLRLTAQQDSFNFDLSTTLVLPTSTMQPLQTVPPHCAMYNSLQSECPTSFEAVNVTYDDCGDAWTVCRCSTANMTMDTAVERLGRIPVGLRRYVATVVVAPDTQTHAYTLTSGDIHMFGDTQVDSWVHEAGHAYDWATGSPLSGTPEWQKAIDSDTCVPDTYSATSAGEDFAQMTVMKVYSLIHENSLPEGWSLDCMSHQMDYMNGLPVFNKAELFGNTCAIAGSDPSSRHSTPPPVTPTRVQPDFPAQVQPNSPLKSGLAAVEDKGEKTPTNKDSAALSTYITDVKSVLFAGGAVLGWLMW